MPPDADGHGLDPGRTRVAIPLRGGPAFAAPATVAIRSHPNWYHKYSVMLVLPFVHEPAERAPWGIDLLVFGNARFLDAMTVTQARQAREIPT